MRSLLNINAIQKSVPCQNFYDSEQLQTLALDTAYWWHSTIESFTHLPLVSLTNHFLKKKTWIWFLWKKKETKWNGGRRLRRLTWFMKAENVCHVVFIDESKVYIRLCVVICIYFTKKQMQRFCLCVTRFIEHIHVAKRSVPANVSSSPLLQQ